MFSYHYSLETMELTSLKANVYRCRLHISFQPKSYITDGLDVNRKDRLWTSFYIQGYKIHSTMSLSFKSAIHIANPTLHTILCSSSLRSTKNMLSSKVTKRIKKGLVHDLLVVVLIEGRSQDIPSYLDTQSDLHIHYPVIFPPKVIYKIFLLSFCQDKCRQIGLHVLSK